MKEYLQFIFPFGIIIIVCIAGFVEMHALDKGIDGKGLIAFFSVATGAAGYLWRELKELLKRVIKK